jgi:hypothetical protein
MGIETAIGAGLGLLGGSKKSGSATSTQTNAPWGGVQGYLTDLYQQANRQYYGRNGGPNLSRDASNQMQSTIRGDYLNPSSNPFLSQSVNDALGLAKSQFAGQYGGQAGGNLGNSGYQEMLLRTLGNVATNAYSNAYGQERQNQLQASQLAPSFEFGPLRELSGILQNAPGGSSTTSQPYFTNPIGGALGGALAGNQIFGSGGNNSGGGLLGGVLGGMIPKPIILG